jgi:hypothetical protein
MRELSDQRQPARELPVAQPAQIAPRLFIGDLDDAYNVNRLCDLGIGFVLNLCPEHLVGDYEVIPHRLAQVGIEHLGIPAQDRWNFDIISEVFDKHASDFIEVGLRSAGVLVNCWGGVNRSAAVAVAHLVLTSHVGLVDAVRHAMGQRGTVLTNYSFRRLLVEAALERNCPLHSGAWPRSE